MSLSITEKRSISASARWLQGLWEYYRMYIRTAAHAAATAALTGFGLLIFIDPLFAALAILSYICPPVFLYSIDADIGKDPDSGELATLRASSETNSDSDSDTDSDSDDGDSDSDSDDGDVDSDGADADADADGADADADADG